MYATVVSIECFIVSLLLCVMFDEWLTYQNHKKRVFLACLWAAVVCRFAHAIIQFLIQIQDNFKSKSRNFVPKTPPNYPETDSGWDIAPETTPRQEQPPQNTQRQFQDAPNSSRDSKKPPRERSKTSQDGLNTALRFSKRPLDLPRPPKSRPRDSWEISKRTQASPKTCQDVR